jgi:hypothetical protein
MTDFNHATVGAGSACGAPRDSGAANARNGAMNARVTHPRPAAGPARAVPTPALSARKLRNRRAAIIGCVGVPARYGGFETLAEQLAIAAARAVSPQADDLVFVPGRTEPARPTHHGVPLRHLPVSANGASSILYDGPPPWPR